MKCRIIWLILLLLIMISMSVLGYIVGEIFASGWLNYVVIAGGSLIIVALLKYQAHLQTKMPEETKEAER
jgi:hypothetical protein